MNDKELDRLYSKELGFTISSVAAIGERIDGLVSELHKCDVVDKIRRYGLHGYKTNFKKHPSDISSHMQMNKYLTELDGSVKSTMDELKSEKIKVDRRLG